MKYFIISNKAVFSALSHLFFQRSKVLMWTVGAVFCFLLQSPARAQSSDKEVKKLWKSEILFSTAILMVYVCHIHKESRV